MSDSCLQKSITMASQTANIRKIVSELLEFVVAETNIATDELHIALSEAIANAIIHGNKNNPRKVVNVQVTIQAKEVIFKVVDEGSGLDHRNLPNPKEDDNLHKRNGRGLFLIRQLMDEVTFNPLGNEITITKYVV